VISDEFKSEDKRALQLWYDELNENEPMMKPRKGKAERKQGGYVCTLDKHSGSRMTGCVSPGVKLARHHTWRHIGTSEVIVTLPNPPQGRGKRTPWLRCNDGGRPIRSSDEVGVMAMEPRGWHVCVSWEIYNRKTG